jgi:hypothetical protein
MKSVQDPTKSVYIPSPGVFRTFSLCKPWNACRVTFHNQHQSHMAGDDAFMYKCNNYQSIEMIVEVLEKIQKRLKLLNRQQLVFGLLESDKNVLYIETGKWWSNPVRLNLLTAFIKDITRCDKLNNVISNGYNYLEQTKEAINKFLDGNVYYGGNFFEGWVDDFSHGRNLNLLQDKPSKNNILQVRYYAGWKMHEIDINKD